MGWHPELPLKLLGGSKMKEVLKQVIIDVLAEKVQDLEWELSSKDQIIEDLEKQLAEFAKKEWEKC
jgi:predicted RNase H-like nuclease (RuvC/YqgF family)